MKQVFHLFVKSSQKNKRKEDVLALQKHLQLQGWQSLTRKLRHFSNHANVSSASPTANQNFLWVLTQAVSCLSPTVLSLLSSRLKRLHLQCLIFLTKFKLLAIGSCTSAPISSYTPFLTSSLERLLVSVILSKSLKQF